MDATCAPPPARPNCDCGARDATRRDGTTTLRRRDDDALRDRGSRARGRGRDRKTARDLDGARDKVRDAGDGDRAIGARGD